MMGVVIKLSVLAALAAATVWALKDQANRDARRDLPPPTPIPAPRARKRVDISGLIRGVAGLFGGLNIGGERRRGGAASAGMAPSRLPVAGGVKALLDFIAIGESGGNYNAVWGGIAAADRPPKRLTSMTVGEVLAWQDRIDPKYNSEAAGKYQILEDTLRGLGLPLSMRFDRAGQDRAAQVLLDRRGWRAFKSGSMRLELFALSLAKEWASLPVLESVAGRKRRVKAGQSYYAGDGLNRASASTGGFERALKRARGY